MLELILRVEERPGRSRDVAISYAPDHTVADVAAALAEHLGLPGGSAPGIVCDRIGRTRLVPTGSLSSSGLLTGDVIRLEVLGGLSPLASGPPGPVLLTCDVVGGPSTGRSLELRAGRVTIGRDPGCDLPLDDPTVSARHLVIAVADDGTATIGPAGPTKNPSLLDGVELVEQVPLDVATGPGSGAGTATARMVRMGATTLALRVPDLPPVSVRDRLGLVPFNRTPYRRPAPREREIDGPGRPPVRPARQQLQVASILLSIAAPAGLALLLGRLEFLAFAVVGPLGAIVNRISERRSGVRTFRQETELFAERRSAWLERLEGALTEERRLRNSAAPDIVALARRAERRSADLWPRPRDAGDFLELRVGLGRDTALTTTRLPEAAAGDTLSSDLAEDLRSRSELEDVPISVDLRQHCTFALHGDPRMGEGVAAALLIQAATLHSPEDLIICGALDAGRDLRRWIDWLPHTRSVGSPLPGPHVAFGDDESGDLLRRILGNLAGRGAETAWPRALLCLDERVAFDGAVLSALLEVAPTCGISVIWLGDELALVPRQAAAVLDCPPPASGTAARLWFTDPDLEDRSVDPDVLVSEAADRAARALAPVRDASGSSTTNAIPRIAPLLESIGASGADPAEILERWRSVDRHSLRATIGVGPNGPFEIDLVEHGPHGLIAGTSGSGKSELLQSLIASLIVNHPPTRLNLLFIDYKGGASSNVFQSVPHAVGYVTNLEADLAVRALVSLRAELDRRMRLLEGRAKDLAEMLEHHPDDAPPSLVIIVDEFATLVKEIPEFVAGIVDIAQRGRSLGIHLILATQRPTGVVNDNILANTNLRISLRVLDPGDSMSILGGPDAAHIPAPLRGRGFARLGAGGLLEFQSAYSGAPFRIAEGLAPIEVADFPTGAPRTVHPEPEADEDEARSQLEAVVDGVVHATVQSGHLPGRRPWLEDLPSLLPLRQILDGAFGPVGPVVAGRDVILGVVDEPDRQRQRPEVVNLEQSGGLLIFGTGGSGRSSTLRTLIASATVDAGPESVVVYVLDFGGRSLEGLRGLPNVAAVASADDLEQTTRILMYLRQQIALRQDHLAHHRAENLSALNSAVDVPLERLLLVVDGYEAFDRTFERGELYMWSEMLVEIVRLGRAVGVHLLATADRRIGIPTAVQSAVSGRVILRTADSDGLIDLGIPAAVARTARLGDGRALLASGQTVQIALVSDDASNAGQTAALASWMRPAHDGRTAMLAALPSDVTLGQVAALRPAGGTSSAFILGLADLTLDPVLCDVRIQHFAVIGPEESGRSTTLASAALQLAKTGAAIWAITSEGSPLLATGLPNVVGHREARELLVHLAAEIDGEQQRVLIVDLADALADSLDAQLAEIIGSGDVRVLASFGGQSLSGYVGGWKVPFRAARRMLLLQPDDLGDLAMISPVKARIRPGQVFPPGRGVFIENRTARVVQAARP